MPVDASVMVVEDDVALRDVLLRGLREEGYRTSAAGSGAEALVRFTAEPVNILIIDIGLPDTDGRDLCQAIRARGVDTPVLFLTARDTLTDRLAGFNAGGDDYVTKPFAFAEIVARIEALLRRAGAPSTLELRGLRLDPAAHTVFLDDERVSLTPTEFRILAKLLASAGRTVRRQELVKTAWPHGALVRANTLDTYIARLRRKLEGDPADPAYLITARGTGYRLALDG